MAPRALVPDSNVEELLIRDSAEDAANAEMGVEFERLFESFTDKLVTAITAAITTAVTAAIRESMTAMTTSIYESVANFKHDVVGLIKNGGGEPGDALDGDELETV